MPLALDHFVTRRILYLPTISISRLIFLPFQIGKTGQPIYLKKRIEALTWMDQM